MIVKRPMPEELTNEYSSAVLVGEAAHPLVVLFFSLYYLLENF